MPDERLQATAGTPRPWTFRLSRQVSWLAGLSFLPVFPMLEASVTLFGSSSLLTVAGAAPEFRAKTRFTGFPLSH